MIRKNYFSYLLILLCGAVASAQTFEWGGRFGGDGEDVVLAMHADTHGNIYTTGYFTLNCDFDISDNTSTITTGVEFDCFIQKTASDGTFLWARSIGGASGDNGTKITTDADGNVYVTGVFQGTADFDPGANEFLLTSAGNLDIFVVKLAENGNFVWARSFSGTEYEESNGIGVDNDGNVYISGYFYDPLDFDPGANEFMMSPAGFGDGFVVKLTPEGNFTWAKKFGGGDFDLATGMKVTPGGDVYISGNFAAVADFDPSETETFNLTAGANANGMFLLHLKSDGDFIKAVKLGESVGEGYGYAVDVDNAGNAYVTGYFGGATTITTVAGPVAMNPTTSYNSYVAKIAADGTVTWAKQLTSTSMSISYAVAVNSLNEVVLTGYFNGTMTLGSASLTENTENDSQCFVAKLDTNGNFMWAQQFGGINFMDRCAITLDSNDNIYLSGAFETTADINPHPAQEDVVTSAGFRDNYLIKMSNAILSNPDHEINNTVSLYPNPASNYITIKLPESSDVKEYSIYDMAGRKVMTGTIENELNINISELSNGVYNVLLGNDSYKLIKE
jgi:hypothetical protein